MADRLFMRPLLAAAIGCALSGCMLGPDYVRPDSPLPPEYANASDALPQTTTDTSASSVDTAALARFWERFDDPVLTALDRRSARSQSRPPHRASAAG